MVRQVSLRHLHPEGRSHISTLSITLLNDSARNLSYLIARDASFPIGGGLVNFPVSTLWPLLHDLSASLNSDETEARGDDEFQHDQTPNVTFDL